MTWPALDMRKCMWDKGEGGVNRASYSAPLPEISINFFRKYPASFEFG